jgi:hypothetical protein
MADVMPKLPANARGLKIEKDNNTSLHQEGAAKFIRSIELAVCIERARE